MLDLLRRQVRSTVVTGCDEPTLRAAMLRALARPGFPLNDNAPCRDGLLTLNVYAAIRGGVGPVALLAGAGVELQMAAAYIFDDLADQDQRGDGDLTPGEELALAVAMMACGSAAVSQAAREAQGAASGTECLPQFHRHGLEACAGQFLDAYLGRLDGVTTDQALAMTALKSGSIGKLAATFGASIATDDPETIRLCGELGLNLFTYLQLVDDLRDACPAQGPLTDLMQRKKTVPLVFFYHYVGERHLSGQDGIIHPPFKEKVNLEVRREFQASGAEAFGAIVAVTFLNRAKANLADLKVRLGMVENLGQLVNSLEISHQQILSAA